MMPRVLLIDDDEDALRYVTGVLQAEHDVVACHGGGEGIEHLRSRAFDLVVTDLDMPPPDGFDVLRAIGELTLPPRVAVLTALDHARTAVDAIRLGADDYIVKPAAPEEIRSVVTRCLSAASGAARDSETCGLVGTSEAIRHVRRLVPLLARSSDTVLLIGETGTGKELLARAIHGHGPRAGAPFVAHNMAATPTELTESIFFGHVRGAFSGAHADHAGLFELAHGGTLFLDELDSLPLGLQPKLLRALECGCVQRVGTTVERAVDVRVIAASAVDPGELVARGAFRADLYYRVRQLEVVMPPLRERMQDLPLLVDQILSEWSRELRVDVRLSPQAEALLSAYPWPGNVRELRHALRAAAVLADSDVIRPCHLPRSLQDARPQGAAPAAGRLEDIEWAHILRALESAAGNRSRAARMLGIDRGTLARRLRRRGG